MTPGSGDVQRPLDGFLSLDIREVAAEAIKEKKTIYELLREQPLAYPA